MQYKDSDHPQSIEDHLKALKNTAKGNYLEAHYSRNLEKLGVPILVSSKFLREYNCGQIDLAVYSRNIILIFEVKNKKITLSQKQYYRLHNSMTLLTAVFNAPGQLKILNCLPKD